LLDFIVAKWANISFQNLHIISTVFFPSVIGENIPTAEFRMISAETACWDIEENSQISNVDFYFALYLPLWPEHMRELWNHIEDIGIGIARFKLRDISSKTI
jgi:hypothetical protein